jgi:hypothetical protein
VPGLTEQDVADLKHLLPSLKLDRGVITRLEREMFELRVEVGKLTEQLEPEPVAAKLSDHEAGESVSVYNRAVAGASPASFIEQTRPLSVALSRGRPLEPGAAPVVQFAEAHGGGFLLVQDGDDWLLFPKQESTGAQLTDIEQCFVVEHGSQEPVNKNLVQFMRRAALCVPAERGWVLEHKGHLFILGLPAREDLA